jgi:hypothetical protein
MQLTQEMQREAGFALYVVFNMYRFWRFLYMRPSERTQSAAQPLAAFASRKQSLLFACHVVYGFCGPERLSLVNVRTILKMFVS